VELVDFMPLVSVIVPCYNEGKKISLLLSGLINQDFPLHDIEVIIADGMSTDNTREVIDNFSHKNPDLNITVIDNEKRTIPAALNKAILSSVGEYIIRLDAHSIPDISYISKCVEGLDKRIADNIGGIWEIEPGSNSAIARAIASAASHPLAVGDARYRYSKHSGYVDTVPFGAFHRSLIEKIGFFDESLLTNEDYEFNTRIRLAGGKIWLDPTIKSKYFARATIIELTKQYWRYGYWKAIMLRRYPGSLRCRQVLPPVFVLSLVIFGFFSLIYSSVCYILIFELTLYLLMMLSVGLSIGIRTKMIFSIFFIPLTIATMHISWGSSFLWSSFKLFVFKDENKHTS